MEVSVYGKCIIRVNVSYKKYCSRCNYYDYFNIICGCSHEKGKTKNTTLLTIIFTTDVKLHKQKVK